MSTLAEIVQSGLFASRPAAATAGRIYFATDTAQTYRDNGTTWDDVSDSSGGAGDLLAANNLSDLASAATARTNLGLGTAATKNTGTTAGTVAAGDDSRITGALQAASNLSDLANAGTARGNLGLGTAAVLNVPASGNAASGEAVKGDDTRLSDARTPATHHTSHNTGGTDAIAPADIGAAAASHTHTASAVTDFSEAVDDRVAALLVAGTNVTLTYNDPANTLTIDATGGGGGSALTVDEVDGTPSDAATTHLTFPNGSLTDSAGHVTYAPPLATVSVQGEVVLATPSSDTTAGHVVQASDGRLNDARPPNGSAGGDLSGTYPNPALALITAGYMDVTEIAAPSNPASGKLRLYAKTDHTLHTLTNGGTDTALGAGGGGGTAWQTLTDGSSISWATGSGNGAQVTLGGNRALANPTGLTGGQTYTLRVIQDGTGSRTLTYGNAYYFPYGAPPRLSTAASAADVLVFESDGTNLYFVACYANVRNSYFDPTSIANCTLWLKADAISASDGDALGTWTDSSGNSHDMTQATAGKKPIYHTNRKNGLPAVTFDNSDDTMSGSLSVASSTAFTVFAVFSQATAASNRRILQGSNNWLVGQNQGGRWAYYNSGMAFAPEYVIAGQWACLCATQAAAGRGVLYVNSIPMAVSDATTGPGTVWLGAGGSNAESADGDVGEVLIYTRQLTQTEMRDVHTYLLRKWGIGLAV